MRVEGGEVVIPTPPHLADGTPLHELSGPVDEAVLWSESRFELSGEDRERYQRSPLALALALRNHGPAPGLREALLGLPAPQAQARSDSAGRFEIELGNEPWSVDVSDPRWVLVREFGRREAGDWTLVAAPAVRVQGVVVDEDGAPVAGARVQHSSSDEALRELAFARGVDLTSFSSFSAEVDELGRFELGRLPRFASDTIRTYAEGFESTTINTPAADTFDFRLVLKRRAHQPLKPSLHGIVLDADGNPAASAHVYLGQDRAQCGADGRFELALSCCHDGRPLVAVLAGAQPALIEDFGSLRPLARDDVVLRLGPPTLAIRGKLKDSRGKPVAHAHVQVFDGVAFCSTQCYIEDASAGRMNSGVATDKRGEFELGGLSERPYRLLAWWDDVVVVSDPIPAGSEGVVLAFDAARVHARVRGRVVARSGEALSDVSVAAKVDMFRSPLVTSHHLFGQVKTDAEGRFTLLNVPCEFVALGVSGPGIDTRSFELPEDPNLEFTLVATVETRVELEIPDERVTHVRFLDERGEEVVVGVRLPGAVMHQYVVERVDGVFPQFDLLDTAVTAVLCAGERELSRAEIRVERRPSFKLRL